MNDENSIFVILNNIYSTYGRDKNYWKDLLLYIKKIYSYKGIIHYFNQRLINEPSNIITLDILDYIIDFGPISLLRELSKIDLMINVFNLLKKSSGSGLEVQKKGIYLTKKWFELANKIHDEHFEGFIRNYQELYKKGITFPPNGFKLNTYEQYISIYEINSILSKINLERNKNNKSPYNNIVNYNNPYNNYNNNKFFLNNDSNITPFEQESKYNKNDDIPSNDMPQLNNFENHGYLDNNKIFNNNQINNINDNIFDENNKFQEYYFDKKDFQENEIQKKEKYQYPSNNLNQVNNYQEEFQDNFTGSKYNSFRDKPRFNKNKDENFEKPTYPENNNHINNTNNKKINSNDFETPIGVDLYCAPNIKNTPLGNKNPLNVSNKKYNTIYNNGFKSYMDVKYGDNNKNNNNNNNFNNSNNENNNKFNKLENRNNSYNQFNINNSLDNINDQNNPTFLYKHSWSLKIELYNKWIDNGSNIPNPEQLKLGIKNILYEFNKIESLLQKYNKEGDLESVGIILKLKSDMNQTCYRYERFINNQSYDKFYSAFNGNIQVYNFNKNFLLDYIDINKEKNNKYVEGLKKFGGVMKNGLFTAGKAVKDSTVKGFNFVKEKVHRDKNNEQNNLNDQKNDKSRRNYNSNVKDYSNSSDCNYFNNNININDNITPLPFNDQTINYYQQNNNNNNFNGHNTNSKQFNDF